jgi:hypothetical protein
MAAYFAALFSPGREGSLFLVTRDIWLALGAGIVLSLAPALTAPPRPLLRGAMTGAAPWAVAAIALLALGKAVTVTFQPFLYFRF